MSILNTGRQQLAQADQLNKASTNLRNQMASNSAGLEIADRNAKRSARGQALGSGAAMAISSLAKDAPVGALNAGLANAPGTSGGLAQLANEGYQIGNAATTAGTGATATGAATGAASTGAASTTAGAATGAATTGAAAAETTGALAASSGAAASGAAAGSAATTAAGTAAAGSALAGAGSAAMAAIPYIGWAAAIGSLAYSLFA